MSTENKEQTERDVLMVALTLYDNLPKRKQKAVMKWVLKNGWDVSHEWKKCVKVARRMVEIKNHN